MFGFFNLADKPEYIEEVISWLHNEWGDKNSLRFWDCWVRSSLSLDDIPQTIIVLDDKELIGTYSLWRCDLQSRQDLFPWLGGVVVKAARRGQGIGIKIQQHALAQLEKIGHSKAYLYTEIKGFYEKTGWQYIGDAPDEKDNMVRLYVNQFTISG
jgi:N-acetylglutamate synthase-like GNAT family acetyltransferase